LPLINKSDASTPATLSLKSTSIVVRLRTVAPAAGIRVAIVGGVLSGVEASDRSMTKSLLLPSDELNACTAMTFVPGTKKMAGFASTSFCGGTGSVRAGDDTPSNGTSPGGML